MNRLTVLVDISSRVMHATVGSPRSVAGAVAVNTSALDALRSEMRSLPKWGRATEDNIGHVVDVLRSQAVSVAVVSVNRDTDAWRKFVAESDTMHAAIVKDSKRVAGWASAANLLKFFLLCAASAAATGHAIRVDRSPKILSARGLQLIDCTTICDNEVEGPENLEVFTSFWSEQHIPRTRLAQFGVEMSSSSIAVTTDHADPALLLADYAAGLGLAYTLQNQGRRPLPITQQRAREFLNTLNQRGIAVVQEEDFDHSCDGVFGYVMEKARELADA